MKSAEAEKPVPEESPGPKESIIREGLTSEQVAKELMKALPMVRRTIAQLEKAKKVDWALLEREITI